ncbi:MAG: glycine C-acetyltransferase [Planctomycetes bacterium]|nr:glycine C-acetyltransferase [Planctomycetota bacterium]
MYEAARDVYRKTLADIREAGLWKSERVIVSPQGADILVARDAAHPEGARREVVNFCANNYLGLGNHPALVAAAKHSLDTHGYGLSSVRFICGTQDAHKTLERKVSEFLRKDDTILYSSCFDANGGLFETLLGEDDAIISDELNHASIIDGIRLCKADRQRYKHMDLADLERLLVAAQGKRLRMVATDGVFSMDGDIAELDKIADLCERYNAMLMVDDSHATGFLGKTGRGSIEHCGVIDRVDVVTSTLGKALGGASGGFTSGRKEIIDLLRQKSRPYLFSNTVPPAIVAAATACIDLLSSTTELRDRLEANTKRFREGMTKVGLKIRPGVHPICPVMLGDARIASQMAELMLEEGIYVVGFSFPVVPKGLARIRVQISAAHTTDHIDRAIAAFAKVGKQLGLV